jgi:hypothetical protein
MTVFRTADEINYLKALHSKNRALFYQAADLILDGKRTYAGDGMRVNVKKVRLYLEKRILQDKANQRSNS